MNRVILSCIVFFCSIRDLFAQATIHNGKQNPPELPISMSLTVDVSTIPLEPITFETYQSFLNYNNKPYGIVGDIGDLLLMPADFAFDAVLSGLHFIGSVEQDTIISKVMNVEVHSEVHLFPELMTHFIDREQRFLGGFSGTYLSTPQLEDGNATVDMHDFMAEQQKVIWDVLKKTYFAKYRFQAEERLREDAFYVNKWQGFDFIALPPFIAGYLYYRGLDRHYDIGNDVSVHILIEPGHRLLVGDVIGAAMVDIRPKNFPIGIVASMGLYGHPAFEFIGIGTSIDAVKKAIALAHD